MAEDSNGKFNGLNSCNSRLSTVVSWMVLSASIALQAGILLTRVNIISDEVKEFKTTIIEIKTEQIRRGYILNDLQHRLDRIERKLKLD